MLTPQEVSDRSFSKATFGGYNMVQVDEFLDILTGDYSTLYSENAVLKSKMKVLVDKVEEYRSTEEAMRKALMTAQRMADELIHEAEEKKAAMLTEVEQKKSSMIREIEQRARQQMGEITRQIELEERRLQAAQTATARFVSQVRDLQMKENRFLDSLDQLCPADGGAEQPAPAQPVQPDQNEAQVEQAVSDIDDSVQRILAQAISDATAENLRAKEDDQPQDLSDTAEFPPLDAQTIQEAADQEVRVAPGEAQVPAEEQVPVEDDLDRTRRIDFGELQFGRDYEIK